MAMFFFRSAATVAIKMSLHSFGTHGGCNLVISRVALPLDMSHERQGAADMQTLTG